LRGPAIVANAGRFRRNLAESLAFQIVATAYSAAELRRKSMIVSSYERHRPEDTLLYQTLQTHWRMFLASALCVPPLFPSPPPPETTLKILIRTRVIGNSFENVKSNRIGPSMFGVKFGSTFPFVAAAVWVAGTVAGCSFAFVQRPPPAARPASGAVGCTSTYLSPIMDSVLVALAVGNVAANEAVGNAALRQPYTVGNIATAATFTALTAAVVVSAAYGYVEVHACREDEAVPFKPALAAPTPGPDPR
jgi:hypothetical protein